MVRLQLESIAQEAMDLNLEKAGYTAYYVNSEDGLDTYPGDSWEQPFKTIQHAVDEAKSWAKIFVKALADSDAAANANSGQKDVIVTDVTGFIVGEAVRIWDDNATELNEIASINTTTNTLTMTTNLANNYTVAASARVVGVYNETVTTTSSQNNVEIIGEAGDTRYTVNTPIIIQVVFHGAYSIVSGITAYTKINIQPAAYRSVAKDCKIIDRIEVHADRCVIDSLIIESGAYNATDVRGDHVEVKNCFSDGAVDGIDIASGADYANVHDNTIKNSTGIGKIGINVDGDYAKIYHNNIVNNNVQTADSGTGNVFNENYYDDHTVDTDHDGLCDAVYTSVGAGTPTDYAPVSCLYGWKQRSLGFAKSSSQPFYLGTEIFEDFEYVSNAALQAVWIHGGDAIAVTRDPGYHGQYSMEFTNSGAGAGHVYKIFAARNMSAIGTINFASRSGFGSDSFKTYLYDSSGNYSYWTLTCAAGVSTWDTHTLDPHTAPTGASATPADITDIVQIRFEVAAANVLAFDYIRLLPADDELDALIAALDMRLRPSIDFIETWQDEAGIDATVWTVTDPATGAAWSRGASGAYLRATSAPNANETARLVSDQRWVAAPDTYGTDTILRRLVLEFELKLTTVANIDNTLSFLGLTSGAADNRSTNNIIGFALASDILQSVTDNGGTETVNTTFGETLTNWNKLKIDIYAGHVKFYVNEVEKADHTTNLPDAPMYLNHFIDTEAGGAATVELGVIRTWTEDISR